MSDIPTPLSTEDILRTALVESDTDACSDDVILSLLSQYSLATSSPSSSSSTIPSLTSSSHKHTLVRFRCLLQDTTHGPEIFLPASQGNPQTDNTHEIDYAKLRERQVVFAVGVPGETAWVDQIVTGSTDATESATNAEPHPSVAHKFPYLQAKTAELAQITERVGAYIKTYNASSPSPPTTVQTYIGLLTFQSPPSALETDASPAAEPQIPTIHVLDTIEHSGSLVPATSLSELGEQDWASTRKELVRWIATVGLGGEEEWVAEWILVSLCTKNLPPLTPLSLAILLPSGPTPTSGLSPLPLYHLLSHLVPLLHPLPLSLPVLNTSNIAPRSTPSEDLAAGALQLPKGGLLYIDETPLGEGGKVTERGMRNLEIANKVVKEQKIEYQFEYSAFGFGTDLGVITVGEGRGGLIEVDAKLHLAPRASSSKPFATASEVATSLPPAATLMDFRSLLVRAREASVVVPKEVSESIQQHFVSHRSTHGPSSLTAEDLSLRMKLARGLALSLGQATLTEQIWQRAWRLDEQRIARSAETAPKPTGELLGQKDPVETVKGEEEEESDDELEIEGGPVNGTGTKRMVGR